MTRILNFRGTNGSGKTTLAMHILGITTNSPPPEIELGHMNPSKTGKKRPIVGYRRLGGVDADVVLVGRYETNTGGCDGIDTMDNICAAVVAAVNLGPQFVIFEGLLVSGLYGRWLELARDLVGQGHSYLWVYLNTPLEDCIRRVIDRTKKKPGWDDGNVRSKYRAVVRTRERAIADGQQVVDCDGSQMSAAELLALPRATR